MLENFKVTLLEHPTDEDWLKVKQRALVTIGKKSNKVPDMDWKIKILKAAHSPIRKLEFSFYLENIPSWVATHLARHIHAQPYIKSQRNDRQANYDRNKAPQDTPVNMIWDMNAEELITISHKRLCYLASEETREVVKQICKLVVESNPEFKGLLVPLCVYRNGLCDEMFPCGKMSNTKRSN